MKPSCAAFIRTNRTLFAVAMLCVLAMKGFGFLGMASAIGKYPDTAHRSFAQAVLGAHCDQHRESGAPQDSQTHYSECCVLCSGAPRDASLDNPMAFSGVVALLTPRFETRTITTGLPQHDPLLASSAGLFTDWSPTAPPVV
jgi:hypothetical protein